jgi:hypothetical protein
MHRGTAYDWFFLLLSSLKDGKSQVKSPLREAVASHMQRVLVLSIAGKYLSNSRSHLSSALLLSCDAEKCAQLFSSSSLV